MSLREAADGRTLIYCHAGCETADVLAAGLNPTSLSLMINGGRAVDPGDERIHRLAQLLGVERSEIFEEEGSSLRKR